MKLYNELYIDLAREVGLVWLIMEIFLKCQSVQNQMLLY